MVAANRVSQRLAHSSTPRNAGGLIFRVRDGYGRQPHRCGRLYPLFCRHVYKCGYLETEFIGTRSRETLDVTAECIGVVAARTRYRAQPVGSDGDTEPFEIPSKLDTRLARRRRDTERYAGEEDREAGDSNSGGTNCGNRDKKHAQSKRCRQHWEYRNH
jgi:hypothetical protein